MINVIEPGALSEFRTICQNYHVACSAARAGIPLYSERLQELMAKHDVNRDDPFRQGVGTPAKGLYPSETSIGHVIDNSVADGEFQNIITKMFVDLIALVNGMKIRSRAE